jgi:glycerol-3-phosphate dehydrogenase (NAD(P)+)
MEERDSYKDLRIGVVGGGSWATALIKMLQNNVSRNPKAFKKYNKVNWFIRHKETIRHIKLHKKNPRYLSSVRIKLNRVKLHSNLNELIQNSDIIILCIPSAFLHSQLESCNANFAGKQVISAVKGIIPEYNMIVCDYLHKRHGLEYQDLGAIVGPCHAEEVAMEKLSYLTIASRNSQLAKFLANKFACQHIKTFTTNDIYGTEYSAVLKNVIAIAAGIAHGNRYGDNFISVLITNAIMEMANFIKIVHPIDRTIYSTEYLGDVLVTSYSKFSRNRTFGTMIGKGYSVQTAQLEMDMIAEGYYAVKCVKEIVDEKNIYAPIIDMVYNVLYKHHDSYEAIRELSEKLK